MSQTNKFREPVCEFSMDGYGNVNELSADIYVSNGQFPQYFSPNRVVGIALKSTNMMWADHYVLFFFPKNF